MKSKWLDWTPGPGSVGFEGRGSGLNSIIVAMEENIAPGPPVPPDEVIEKTAQGVPAKPTELGFVGFEGSASTAFSITSEQPPDCYAERANAALRQINRTDYPGGMIAWLDQ